MSDKTTTKARCLTWRDTSQMLDISNNLSQVLEKEIVIHDETKMNRIRDTVLMHTTNILVNPTEEERSGKRKKKGDGSNILLNRNLKYFLDSQTSV